MRKFEEGKTYHGTFVGDSDSTFFCGVVKRSAKTVTLKTDGHKETKTRRIKIDDNGNEFVFPFGQYSMSPVLRASRLSDKQPEKHQPTEQEFRELELIYPAIYSLNRPRS